MRGSYVRIRVAKIRSQYVPVYEIMLLHFKPVYYAYYEIINKRENGSRKIQIKCQRN